MKARPWDHILSVRDQLKLSPVPRRNVNVPNIFLYLFDFQTFNSVKIRSPTGCNRSRTYSTHN
jgi:hypothetical protein